METAASSVVLAHAGEGSTVALIAIPVLVVVVFCLACGVTYRRVLLAALASVPLAGCAGASCGDLPALRAERDEARAAYGRLIAEPAPAEVTEQADADVHALDRRVFDVEQACEGR